MPYVAKHPEGVPVEALAKQIGADREELLGDLELLSQVGPPDGDPGEYLLVSVDEGRVFVDLAHRLTRPLRLTAAEGCSLLLGIRALRESGVAPFDAAMQSAEKKLLTALGPRRGRSARRSRQQPWSPSPTPRSRRTCARWSRPRASASGFDIDYVSASHHQNERRSIDPYGIVHHAGEWYVVGFCHKRGDVRTFRIDRIAALRPTRRSFERPEDFDLDAYRRERLYVPGPRGHRPRATRSVAVTRIGANWPVGEVTMRDDGSAELLVDCEGFEWVSGWVLELGRHAWIVEPEPTRGRMRDRIARLRAELTP